MAKTNPKVSILYQIRHLNNCQGLGSASVRIRNFFSAYDPHSVRGSDLFFVSRSTSGLVRTSGVRWIGGNSLSNETTHYRPSACQNRNRPSVFSVPYYSLFLLMICQTYVI